jgi:hypothetical protein
VWSVCAPPELGFQERLISESASLGGALLHSEAVRSTVTEGRTTAGLPAGTAAAKFSRCGNPVVRRRVATAAARARTAPETRG